MSTPPGDPRRLSPWSSFTVSDLLEATPGIVSRWAEQLDRTGAGERPRALRDQITWALQGVGRWVAGEDEEVPDELRAVFRDVVFAYRSEGRELPEILADIGRLEDVLIGDDDPENGGAAAVGRRLRRAFRTFWTEAIRLDDALGRRRDRERTDALESFEEILSHELGNRLGAARTGVDILQEAPDGLTEERRQELLGLVGDGIDAALRTVDDVGAFVQAQRWDEEVRQPFDQVVRGVVKGLALQARSEGVALEVDAESLPRIPVDAGRLRLILANFVVNGIRYADQEEDEPYVRLTAAVEDGEIHVRVEDNGIGIPPEEQGEIFRFHRRGRNHAEREGSGLGLTIASEAVAQLGGRIELESEPGEGTTFHVALPAGEAEAG